MFARWKESDAEPDLELETPIESEIDVQQLIRTAN